MPHFEHKIKETKQGGGLVEVRQIFNILKELDLSSTHARRNFIENFDRVLKQKIEEIKALTRENPQGMAMFHLKKQARQLLEYLDREQNDIQRKINNPDVPSRERSFLKVLNISFKNILQDYRNFYEEHIEKAA